MGISEEKQKGGPCRRIRERPNGRRMHVGREEGPLCALGWVGVLPREYGPARSVGSRRRRPAQRLGANLRVPRGFQP